MTNWVQREGFDSHTPKDKLRPERSASAVSPLGSVFSFCGPAAVGMVAREDLTPTSSV